MYLGGDSGGIWRAIGGSASARPPSPICDFVALLGRTWQGAAGPKPARFLALDQAPNPMTPPRRSAKPDPPSVAFEPTTDVHWIWSLANRDVEQAMLRLQEHDSVHLQGAICARTRARYFIVDSERAFTRCCARVALVAADAKGDPPPEEELLDWFNARMDEAIDECLRNDELALRDGLRYADHPYHYMTFVWACMVLPENSLFVSVNYNGLPEICRKSFYVLLMEHRTVADALAMGLGPEARLRENAVRALDAASGIEPRAPKWEGVQDETIGPWWAQEGAFDGNPEGPR